MNQNEIFIEAEELLKKIGDKNIRIFDATITDDVYLKQHIPGANYFDHERFSDPNGAYPYTILPADKLAGQIGKAGISENSEVIIYACGMIPYAVRAWWVLRYAGHDNLHILNGGLTAWIKAGGDVEQVSQSYEPAIYKVRTRPNMFATKDEVFASMEDKDVVIVNVLPPISYQASHIPGSINNSCMDMMDGDLSQGLDYLKSMEQLVPLLADIEKSKRIITYCGGGIAAAVNAAVYLFAGYDNVAVYDGSMYEWLGEGMPVIGTGKWEVWNLK